MPTCCSRIYERAMLLCYPALTLSISTFGAWTSHISFQVLDPSGQSLMSHIARDFAHTDAFKPLTTASDINGDFAYEICQNTKESVSQTCLSTCRIRAANILAATIFSLASIRVMSASAINFIAAGPTGISIITNQSTGSCVRILVWTPRVRMVGLLILLISVWGRCRTASVANLSMTQGLSAFKIRRARGLGADMAFMDSPRTEEECKIQRKERAPKPVLINVLLHVSTRKTMADDGVWFLIYFHRDLLPTLQVGLFEDFDFDSRSEKHSKEEVEHESAQSES